MVHVSAGGMIRSPKLETNKSFGFFLGRTIRLTTKMCSNSRFFNHDYPHSVLHLWESHRKQVGSLPRAAASRIH